MKKALVSVVYMFVITLVFTALVSAVKIANDDRIAQNQKIKLQRIILSVLGIPVPAEAPGKDVLELYDQRIKTDTVDDTTVYIGHDENGKIIGYAFPVGGAGFWGPIYGMLAVNADASEVLGVAFYRHSETPGLGGRISEVWFQKQFDGLPLPQDEGDKKFFRLKQPGTGTAKTDLDAITGASNTSAAVEKFLNQDLHRFLDKMWGDIKKG